MRNTLQEQYNLIKEGKGAKDVFVKHAKQLFPHLVPNHYGFESAATILTQRGIISENLWGIATGNNKQPDWFKLFNENINVLPAEEELKAAGIKYELSGISHSPFKTIYKPINQSDEFYKKFEDIIDRHNLQKYVVSKVNESLENTNKANATKSSKEVDEYKDKSYHNQYEAETGDDVIFDQYLNGIQIEVCKPENAGKTVDELKKVVLKNLKKDKLYYTKNAAFGIEGIGYTEDAPGLGKTKEVKGKYASSGMEPVKLKESVMYSDSDGDREYDMETSIQANEYYDKGLQAYSEGDLLKAEKYYNAALKAGSWLGWTEFDLPPYETLKESNMEEYVVWIQPEGEEKREYSRAKSKQQAMTIATNVYDRYADDYNPPKLGILPAKQWSQETSLNMNIQESKLRSAIRSLIKEELNLKEIDQVGEDASKEAKIKKINDEINKRKKKLKALETLKELEEDSVNPKKIKELYSEIKKLEAAKSKLEKKGKKKEQIVDETAVVSDKTTPDEVSSIVATGDTTKAAVTAAVKQAQLTKKPVTVA